MVALAACGGGGSGGDGKLSASWKGRSNGSSATGALNTGATANWCGAGKLLEIMAISGDTGVAVLLYPTDGVKSGTFAMIDPLREPVHAGVAAVAARWPDGEQIVGFRGVSGSATLTVVQGRISGTITGTMVRPGIQPESLAFTGNFSALQADSGTGACPPDSGGKRVSHDSVVVPTDTGAR
ncbi:MAG: hypothetical protein ABJC74_11875 [Gemmatimonadota bacterium]